MAHLFAVRWLVGALVLAALTAPFDAPAHAQGEDVCPEPNDGYRRACYLGAGADALGFIARPDDTDAYRIEALDFNIGVRVELADRPLPYRLALVTWDGEVVASSDEGMIDATLPTPGSYYLMVDSPSGQFSTARPYRLLGRFSYPAAVMPQLLYEQSFRPGQGEQHSSSEAADFSTVDGRRTVTMKVGGTYAEPRMAAMFVTSERAEPLELADFTLTVDTRIDIGADAGYLIRFRYADQDNQYMLAVNAHDGTVSLTRWAGGELSRLVGWRTSEAVNTSGGVNRTVVRCDGDDLRVYLNGREVIQVTDGAVKSGGLAFGAVTWAEPAIVHFDNGLLTTPTRG